MSVQSVWERVKTKTQVLPYQSVDAERCMVGVVYHLWDTHNAYHGTTSVSHAAAWSFFYSLEDLKQFAERYRREGTSFWYGELPSLVVSNDSLSLAIIQPRVSVPFANYKASNALVAPTVGDLALAIYDATPEAQVWEQVPPLGAVESAFGIYQSSPNGAGKPLRWSRTSRGYSPEHATSLANGIQQGLRAGA